MNSQETRKKKKKKTETPQKLSYIPEKLFISPRKEREMLY